MTAPPVLIERDLAKPCQAPGPDEQAYFNLFDPFVRNWRALLADLLRPVIHFP